MTNEANLTSTAKMRSAGNKFVEWVKIASAIGIFVTFVSGFLTETLGPGIQPYLQQVVGIDKLREDLSKQIEEIELNSAVRFNSLDAATSLLQTHITEMQQYIEPPKVVEWLRVAQMDNCPDGTCTFYVSFVRTKFGENCGLPSVTAQVRINQGYPIDTTLPGFKPIEGTRQGSAVNVGVKIPFGISEGELEWRVVNTYPTCDFPGEPLPRFGPWWKIKM